MNPRLLIPFAIFLALVVVLALGFRLEDPHLLPSEMVDRPFPAFSLTDLESGEPVSNTALPGQVHLVNVWATWCANCLVEHPELVRIADEEGVPLVGVNYNDVRTKAQQWLARHGNPYRFSVFDDEGRLAIDLGVYGAPETYVVDASGTIRYRYVGPVTPRVWRDKIGPVVRFLRDGGGA